MKKTTVDECAAPEPAFKEGDPVEWTSPFGNEYVGKFILRRGEWAWVEEVRMASGLRWRPDTPTTVALADLSLIEETVTVTIPRKVAESLTADAPSSLRPSGVLLCALIEALA